MPITLPLHILDEALNEVIIHHDDQWCVVSHKTGRSLGCYRSEEEAKKRLRQIQFFKQQSKRKT